MSGEWVLKSAPCLVGGILLPYACLAQGDAAFPERQVLESGGYVIEYSAGDDELARSILELVGSALSEAPAQALPEVSHPIAGSLTVDMLQTDGEEFLKEICRYLALAQPTELMRKVHQAFASKFPERLDALTSVLLEPRRFALWRKDELAARLDAGQIIPNFSRDGDKVAWTLNLRSAVVPQSGEAVTTDRESSVPIVITAEDAERGMELARKKADEVLQGQRDNVARARSAMIDVHTVLHEIVEVGVVWGHSLDSKDRRWFCDGVANYVALKVIEGRIGAEAAKRYYDLEQQLALYEDVKDRIDLAGWSAAENQPDEMSEELGRLNRAHYPFATQVIALVCAKHGDDLLPKLFRELQRTPPEKRNMDTVYRAFRKLTREDLRRYFPNRRR